MPLGRYPYRYPHMGWAVHAETRTALDHEILSTGISWTSEDLRRRYGRGVGGASRDRTDDLIHAMDALSQLSYSPVFTEGREDTRNLPVEKRWRLAVSRASSSAGSSRATTRPRREIRGARRVSLSVEPTAPLNR